MGAGGRPERERPPPRCGLKGAAPQRTLRAPGLLLARFKNDRDLAQGDKVTSGFMLLHQKEEVV